MATFSERFGAARPRTTLQLTTMDDELRNGLWNAVVTSLFQPSFSSRVGRLGTELVAVGPLEHLVQAIWMDLLKLPLDTRARYWPDQYAQLREHFMAATWNRVYEFVEFLPNNWPKDFSNYSKVFVASTNRILVRELSGYRFLGTTLIRITDEEELASIEEAATLPKSVSVVSQHIETAIRLLADRKSPDYRNSIKESISAVESFCSLLAGQQKANLASAMEKLEAQIELHPALKKAFTILYGYTSDASGIRHALLDEHELTFDDAKFMLVACSGFVNYLRALASRAGIGYDLLPEAESVRR